MIIEAELTDTFGGEANYSWVTRKRFVLPENASDRQIMKRAKDEVGLSGVKGRWEAQFDLLVFRPYKRLVVLFVTFPTAGGLSC